MEDMEGMATVTGIGDLRMVGLAAEMAGRTPGMER